jgi:hypothetical protein
MLKQPQQDFKFFHEVDKLYKHNFKRVRVYRSLGFSQPYLILFGSSNACHIQESSAIKLYSIILLSVPNCFL